MSLLPNRRTLRSRWSTLIWAGGICVFAASVVPRSESQLVDATGVSGSNAAQASALLAEDDE